MCFSCNFTGICPENFFEPFFGYVWKNVLLPLPLLPLTSSPSPPLTSSPSPPPYFFSLSSPLLLLPLLPLTSSPSPPPYFFSLSSPLLPLPLLPLTSSLLWYEVKNGINVLNIDRSKLCGVSGRHPQKC